MDIEQWQAQELVLPGVESRPLLDGDTFYRTNFRTREMRGLGGSTLNRSNSRRSRPEPADIPAADDEAGQDEDEMFYDALEFIPGDEIEDHVLRLDAHIAGSWLDFNVGYTSNGNGERSNRERVANYYEVSIQLAEQDAFERQVNVPLAIKLKDLLRNYEKFAFEELLAAANSSEICPTCDHQGCAPYGGSIQLQILTQSYVHDMELIVRTCSWWVSCYHFCALAVAN